MLKAIRHRANVEEPREVLRLAFEQALVGNSKMLDLVAPVAVQWSNQDPAVLRLGKDLPQLAEGWLTVTGPASDTEFDTAIQKLSAWRQNLLRSTYEHSLHDGTDDEPLRKALEDRDLAELLGKVVSEEALRVRANQWRESLKARLATCRARNDIKGAQAAQQWARQLASAIGDGRASWLEDFNDAADEQTWNERLKALADATRKAKPSPVGVEPTGDTTLVTGTAPTVALIEEEHP